MPLNENISAENAKKALYVSLPLSVATLVANLKIFAENIDRASFEVKQMKNILIIDDDTELCELLQEYLASEFATSAAHNGINGLEMAQTGNFDLIILDIMLPKMNGLEVLKNLRISSQVPVIMLTAKGDETDRVLGLELGSDDYLPKPFSPRELVARIKAIFRRLGNKGDNGAKAESQKIEIADVLVENTTRTATRNGKDLGLTEVEFSILENLMRTAGNVVERQDLAIKVLGRRLSYDDRSLDVHMSNLRRKLNTTSDSKDRIKTIRGVGYLYVRP